MKKIFFLFLLISCSSTDLGSRSIASVQTIKDDTLIKYVKHEGFVPDSHRKVSEILFGKSGRVYSRITPSKEYEKNKRASKSLVMTLDKKIVAAIQNKIKEMNPEKLLKVVPEKVEPYPCDAGNRELNLVYLNKEISMKKYLDCKGVYKIKKDTKLFTETHNLNELSDFIMGLLELTNLQ